MWTVLSVNTLNEYVEPVTELFSKYSKGNIYFSSFGKDDHRRTKIELSIEGNIPNTEIEYISIGVKLLKHLDPEIEINIELLSEEKLNNYFDNFYESLTIGSVVIHPENKKNNINEAYSNMVVKPGLGFGTGKHPTTKLCLLELQQINNKTVLDIGTGSGCILLSILKELTLSRGIGIDVSAQAIQIAKINSSHLNLNNRSKFKICDINKYIYLFYILYILY